MVFGHACRALVRVCPGHGSWSAYEDVLYAAMGLVRPEKELPSMQQGAPPLALGVP